MKRNVHELQTSLSTESKKIAAALEKLTDKADREHARDQALNMCTVYTSYAVPSQRRDYRAAKGLGREARQIAEEVDRFPADIRREILRSVDVTVSVILEREAAERRGFFDLNPGFISPESARAREIIDEFEERDRKELLDSVIRMAAFLKANRASPAVAPVKHERKAGRAQTAGPNVVQLFPQRRA